MKNQYGVDFYLKNKTKRIQSESGTHAAPCVSNDGPATGRRPDSADTAKNECSNSISIQKLYSADRVKGNGFKIELSADGME